MQAALQSLEEEVRELIRQRRIDPTRDDGVVRQLVQEAVADYEDRALVSGAAPLSDRDEAARVLMESVAGFGPLQPYLDDPTVEEIWINYTELIGQRRTWPTALVMDVLACRSAPVIHGC
jgi:pilus assembly protein CpaF